MSEYRQITEDEAHAMFEIGQEVFWLTPSVSAYLPLNPDIFTTWPMTAEYLGRTNWSIADISFWVRVEE